MNVARSRRKARKMIVEVPTKARVKKYLLGFVDEILRSDLRLLEIELEFHESVPLEQNGVVVRQLSGAKTLKISWMPKKGK